MVEINGVATTTRNVDVSSLIHFLQPEGACVRSLAVQERAKPRDLSWFKMTEFVLENMHFSGI